MKLLNILIESMSDGGAFKAFADTAIAKKEVQSNEGLNLQKKKPTKKETKFVSDNHNIPHLSFDFNRVEQDDDKLLFYGMVEFGGDVFSTALFSDLDGNLLGVDGISDDEEKSGDEFNTAAEGLEQEVGDFFQDVIDKIKDNK